MNTKLKINFIIGCDRSGTTLVAKYTCDVGGLPFLAEAQWLGPFCMFVSNGASVKNALISVLRKGFFAPWIASGVKAEHLFSLLGDDIKPVEFIHSAFDLAYAVTGQRGKINKSENWREGSAIEHTPWAYKYLPFIAIYCDIKKIFHVVRDGRDVCLSLVKQRWGPNNYYCASRYWSESVCACESVGLIYSNIYEIIGYEDFVHAKAKEKSQSKNKDFIHGNTWLRSGRYSAQHSQLKRRIDAKNIGKWHALVSDRRLKHIYSVELTVLLLRKYGYLDDSVSGCREPAIVKKVIFVLHDNVLKLINSILR